jgi:hypothetical protein
VTPQILTTNLDRERSWNGDNQLINAGILAVTIGMANPGRPGMTPARASIRFRLALTTAISAG